MEKQYDYVSTNIKDVMEDITKYVIPENRLAIELLWSRNILTTQTNNYDNDSSFICIGDLSEENERLFWDYYNSHPRKVRNEPTMGIIYGGRGIEIPVVPGTCDTFSYFKPFIHLLSYQDVQKDGYMTIPEFFLKYTDCWSIIKNPSYAPLKKPVMTDYADSKLYYQALAQYLEGVTTLRKIRVFDETKMTKSLEEYIKEYGFLDSYDSIEGKIYYNRRLYEGHLQYKKYQDSLHR